MLKIKFKAGDDASSKVFALKKYTKNNQMYLP